MKIVQMFLLVLSFTLSSSAFAQNSQENDFILATDFILVTQIAQDRVSFQYCQNQEQANQNLCKNLGKRDSYTRSELRQLRKKEKTQMILANIGIAASSVVGGVAFTIADLKTGGLLANGVFMKIVDLFIGTGNNTKTFVYTFLLEVAVLGTVSGVIAAKAKTPLNSGEQSLQVKVLNESVINSNGKLMTQSHKKNATTQMVAKRLNLVLSKLN